MPPDWLRSVDRNAVHGTRGRYTLGCRCRECKDANVRRYHRKQEEAIEAARALGPGVPGALCAGARGNPCPKNMKLQRRCIGPVCASCRMQLIWDGLVKPDRVIAHVKALSKKNVGYKAVADAASVARSTMRAILAGKRKHISAQKEERILAVTGDARADGSLVPAAATQYRLTKLLKRGFTRTEIARLLGSKAKHPALQIRRGMVLASTALKVRKLFYNAGKPTKRPVGWCSCKKKIVLDRDGVIVCAKCERRVRG